MRQIPYVPIVPLQPVQRDCIVVDGHKYCKDADMTAHDGGILILLFVLPVAWFVGGLFIPEWLFDYEDRRAVVFRVIWFFAPPLLIAIILLAS